MKSLNYENYYINLANKQSKELNIDTHHEIAVTNECSEAEWLEPFEKWLKSFKTQNIEYIVSLDNSLSSVALTQSIQNQIDEAYELGYTRVAFPLNAEIEVIDLYDGLRPNSNYTPTFLSLKSNTVYDLNGSTIKVKANNYIHYNVISLQLLDRTILKNGNIIGDKDNHSYDDTSTHEWGYGVLFSGSKQTRIENLNISKMTGDGCYMGGIISYYSTNVSQADMVKGIINNTTGEDADGDGYRLTKFIELSSLLNSADINKGLSLNNKLILFAGNSSGYGPAGQFSKKEVSVLFYNSSYTFLSEIDSIIMQPINIPQGACYIKYYFPNTDMTSMTNQLMMLRIGELSEECYIDGCDIGNCRRQGCSISKSINSGVINSIIHDIKGTSPQSCIDIEDGGHTTQSIIIENNIFKNSPCGVICYDGSYHTINKNYFHKISYPISVNTSAGVSINDCTMVGGKVGFSAISTSSAYLPQNLTVNNINVINADQFRLEGNVHFSGGTVKNAKNISISKGAYAENILFSQEYTVPANHIIDSSQLFNCTFTSNDNVYLINVKNSILDTIELTKGAIILGGNTTIKNSTINQFKFLSSYPLNSKLLFYNCILGITDNPWGVTSNPSTTTNIKFINCIITEQTESAYGLIPLYDNTSIIFENSQITDLVNNNLHYSNKLKGLVKYKNCTIKGKSGAVLYNINTDVEGVYLIDSEIVNFTRPDITDTKIIDEDCEWRNG